jgi:signal transduction histidine kinase
MSPPALPSIRRRLSQAVLGIALVWGLAVSAVVWLAVRHEVNELLDDSMRAAAEVLRHLVEPGAEAFAGREPPALADTPGGHRFAWQLVGPGPGGRVLLRSAQAPAQPWLAAPQTGFSSAVPRWRVYGVALDGGRMLYVAQSRAERTEALVEVSVSSIVAALFVGLGAVAWLRVRVRREMAPLAALPAALAAYEPLDPAPALADPTRAELAPVHDAVLALGRRLAQRVAGERAFSAHAAHALRTPLAGIDAQLAVALREAPPELAARLQRVRAAAGRLARVVTALLALFRSGVKLQRGPVDVAAMLARLPVDGLAVETAAGTVDADADLLAAALLNLLDNAARHGATHVAVTLAGQQLRLADDGPGFDAARRDAMQAALARRDYDSAEGGLGLGLMLADLVARAHGGALRLPAAARGFLVELDLGRPGAAAAPAG